MNASSPDVNHSRDRQQSETERQRETDTEKESASTFMFNDRKISKQRRGYVIIENYLVIQINKPFLKVSDTFRLMLNRTTVHYER